MKRERREKAKKKKKRKIVTYVFWSDFLSLFSRSKLWLLSLI